jgi:RNase H-fold protein (predicted Holliday junction resolvase)
LVNSGALELLDPAEAEKYYAENAGKKKRMEKKIAEMRQLPKSTGENIEVRIDGKPVTSEKTPQRKSAKEKINGCVDNICLKLQHDAISSADAIEALEERESEFKKSDWDYLMKSSKSDAVTAWAIKHSQKG